VKGALAVQLFSVKLIGNVRVAYQTAKETWDFLLKLDKDALQKSFGEFLSQYEFDIHIIDEKYYHTLFINAMFFAKQSVNASSHTSHGIIDILLRDKYGNNYIIELKYHAEPKDSSGKYPALPQGPEEEARLRQAMAPLAREALSQISRKYQQTHSRGPGKLIKVALVIARRSFVLAEFEVVRRQPV
jgi:hypothetical protein